MHTVWTWIFWSTPASEKDAQNQVKSGQRDQKHEIGGPQKTCLSHLGREADGYAHAILSSRVAAPIACANFVVQKTAKVYGTFCKESYDVSFLHKRQGATKYKCNCSNPSVTTRPPSFTEHDEFCYRTCVQYSLNYLTCLHFCPYGLKFASRRQSPAKTQKHSSLCGAPHHSFAPAHGIAHIWNHKSNQCPPQSSMIHNGSAVWNTASVKAAKGQQWRRPSTRRKNSGHRNHRSVAWQNHGNIELK
jgi:hypothetical protein